MIDPSSLYLVPALDELKSEGITLSLAHPHCDDSLHVLQQGS